MGDEKGKGMEFVRDYSKAYYGVVPDHYEMMGRYLPESMANWIALRKSVFEVPPIGAFSLREKELICTAIEIANLKPDSTLHARLAIREGATPKDIAEVAFICILLGGMMTYIVSGVNALKAAEEEYEKLMKEKKGK